MADDSEPEITGEKQDTRFKPGQSGNPDGRPRGSRNKLVEDFFKDLYAKWQEKGPSAIDAMIAERPGDFVKCVASQMPKEFSLNANVLGELSDSELGDFLAAIRAFKEARGSREAAGDGGEETTRH